jgi:excisionase family DNA binding protein
MGKLLTVAEAAELLGVSDDTVRRWVEDGALGAVRTYGGHFRFREAEVLAFRRQGQRAAGRTVATASQLDAGVSSATEPDPPEWQRLRPWEQKKARVETELAIHDLVAERRRQREERLRERDADRQAMAEETRLNDLKLYGLSQLSGFDSEQKPRLVRLLERFVTSQQIPAYLPDHEQKQLVYDRVRRFNDACWPGWGRRVRGE